MRHSFHECLILDLSSKRIKYFQKIPQYVRGSLHATTIICFPCKNSFFTKMNKLQQNSLQTNREKRHLPIEIGNNSLSSRNVGKE